MSRKPSYTLEYSANIKEELRRLENGNADENQRFRNAQTTIAKIRSNPINSEFNKDLPENYKAADVLQQYRLFFKIHNINNNNSVIYLAWINDDESLHASGSKDDAYNVFRKFLEKGQIESYKHIELDDGHEYFQQNGDWGENVIYFQLTRKVGEEDMLANSHLYMSRQTETEYRIDSISVSHAERKLAQSILVHICNEAEKKSYTIYYELNTNLDDVDKNRHILEKHGFSIDSIISETEIWVK